MLSREDAATAAGCADAAKAAALHRDIASAAESGWDFSSRWLGTPGDLATARTTRIIPADLNAFLCQMEANMQHFATVRHCRSHACMHACMLWGSCKDASFGCRRAACMHACNRMSLHRSVLEQEQLHGDSIDALTLMHACARGCSHAAAPGGGARGSGARPKQAPGAAGQVLEDRDKAARYRRAHEARRYAITSLMLDQEGACWRDLLLLAEPGQRQVTFIYRGTVILHAEAGQAPEGPPLCTEAQ
jgi:hypothetical protein